MGYQFLANLKLVDTGRTRVPKEKNPTGMTVRIYSDGSVYPSAELVAKYKLQYRNKGINENGYGFDVIDSLEWEPLKTSPRMILFGVTRKGEPKVDLFASCKFHDDERPKADVMTQGSVSTTLLDLVRSLGYMTPDQKYTDLQLVEEYPINTDDGISYIPKTMERGAKRGEKTYVKRENVTYFAVNTPENLEEMKKQSMVPIPREAEPVAAVIETTN